MSTDVIDMSYYDDTPSNAVIQGKEDKMAKMHQSRTNSLSLAIQSPLLVKEGPGVVIFSF